MDFWKTVYVEWNDATDDWDYKTAWFDNEESAITFYILHGSAIRPVLYQITSPSEIKRLKKEVEQFRKQTNDKWESYNMIWRI